MDIKINPGCILKNNADEQLVHHLVKHMKNFESNVEVKPASAAHMFGKEEIKRAKKSFQKSIGTLQFKLERDRLLKSFVNAKTPRWGSLNVGISNYPGYSFEG